MIGFSDRHKTKIKKIYSDEILESKEYSDILNDLMRNMPDSIRKEINLNNLWHIYLAKKYIELNSSIKKIIERWKSVEEKIKIFAEGNLLIAQFMGAKPETSCKNNEIDDDEPKPEFRYNNVLERPVQHWEINIIEVESIYGIKRYSIIYVIPEEMRYHLDWNWLMPVVEKILSQESLKTIKEDLQKSLSKGQIIGVYERVVDYVKNYNKSTKKL